MTVACGYRCSDERISVRVDSSCDNVGHKMCTWHLKYAVVIRERVHLVKNNIIWVQLPLRMFCGLRVRYISPPHRSKVRPAASDAPKSHNAINNCCWVYQLIFNNIMYQPCRVELQAVVFQWINVGRWLRPHMMISCARQTFIPTMVLRACTHTGIFSSGASPQKNKCDDPAPRKWPGMAEGLTCCVLWLLWWNYPLQNKLT